MNANLKSKPPQTSQTSSSSKDDGNKDLADLKSQLQKSLLDVQKIQSLPDPKEMEAVLRKELLLSRAGPHRSGYEDWKHEYLFNTASINMAQTTAVLTRIASGNELNQRTGNVIKLKKLNLRFVARLVPTAKSNVAVRAPVVTFLVWRDKIPSTPGSVPTIIDTGSNPPSDNTTMFNRLGSADARFNSIAIRNPMTFLDYHIYKIEHVPLNPSFGVTDNFTNGFMALGPKSWHFHYEIPLHYVQQVYLNAAANVPQINDLYFSWWSDLDLTGIGYSIDLQYTSDIEFQDVLDGV